MTLLSDEVPLPMIIDLTELEEACFRIKIDFKVNREIASDLHHVIRRKGINVDKQTYMVGNDCPKEEEQECLTPDDEAPKGKMARGRYRVKSSFSDDDTNVYLNWE
ncbi:rho GDP-dissociation inhibitor 1-like [Pseudochaenichthys georgianus]|uniref:rho GDP-dissociation inhibitor 1-like n=1 Tax=Pseudochaenichthys georgianus TaxID=52239 RepID=UPI0039C1FAB9